MSFNRGAENLPCVLINVGKRCFPKTVNISSKAECTVFQFPCFHLLNGRIKNGVNYSIDLFNFG